MKRIECGDLVPGCDFHAQAETEAEVLSAEASHAREAHTIVVTSSFLERARQRIRDIDLGGAKAVAARRARG